MPCLTSAAQPKDPSQAAGGNAEKLVRINSNGSGMANDDLEIVASPICIM